MDGAKMEIYSARLQFHQDLNLFLSAFKRLSVVVALVTIRVKVFDVDVTKQEWPAQSFVSVNNQTHDQNVTIE